MRTALARLALGAVASTALAAAVAPPALADGTQVGGSVPSLLALGLTGGEGLGQLPSVSRPRTLDLRIGATVTATEAPIVVTIVDGDTPDGRAHGRLATSAGPLPDPLLVQTAGAWTSLADPDDPRVARLPDVVASKGVPVRVRQSVPPGPARSVAPKTLLVTLSVEGP